MARSPKQIWKEASEFHDACAESLGNDMRMYVANSTEAVDFVEMIVDDACFMSRSWASYDLDDDWENRFVKMPSAWECSIV